MDIFIYSFEPLFNFERRYERQNLKISAYRRFSQKRGKIMVISINRPAGTSKPTYKIIKLTKIAYEIKIRFRLNPYF